MVGAVYVYVDTVCFCFVLLFVLFWFGLGLFFFLFVCFFYCLVGCFSVIVWTPAVLSVLYACVLYFCIAPVQRN